MEDKEKGTVMRHMGRLQNVGMTQIQSIGYLINYLEGSMAFWDGVPETQLHHT